MIQSQRGFVYLWAMFAVTVAGLVLAGTGQTWQVKAQREKELELLFIGEEFREAIMSYHGGGQGGTQGGQGGTQGGQGGTLGGTQSAAQGGARGGGQGSAQSGTQGGTQGGAQSGVQGAARGATPGGTGKYPDSLEQLLEDKRSGVTIRHLRKIYLDPMTKTDDWGLVAEPPPEDGSGATRSNISNGIIGVYSLSNKKPMKKENFPEHFAKFSEAETYQDWQFVFEQDGGGNQTQQQNQQNPAGSQPSSSSPFASPSTPQSGPGSSSPFASPSASPSGQGGQGGQSGQGSASPFSSGR